jgi:formylglycine-generating enzyme required for sulfatase activity
MVSWYEAAAYCNWLSEQDGIPKAQWCYLPNEHGEYAEGMRIVPDALSRSGYRLPTAAEWEYACRAGGATTWSPGEAQDLLPKYAWHVSNSWSQLHPVGTLRPNNWGLFDMHGNAWEWCQDGGTGRASGAAAGVVTDAEGRVVRGGAFAHDPLVIQSSHSIAMAPTERGGDMGFRPARTVP